MHSSMWWWWESSSSRLKTSHYLPLSNSSTNDLHADPALLVSDEEESCFPGSTTWTKPSLLSSSSRRVFQRWNPLTTSRGKIAVLVCLCLIVPTSLLGSKSRTKTIIPEKVWTSIFDDGDDSQGGLNDFMNHGWRMFVPSPPQEETSSSNPQLLSSPRSLSRISPRCTQSWIINGEVCPTLKQELSQDPRMGKVDVLWTWVNGTDEDLGNVRDDEEGNYDWKRKSSIYTDRSWDQAPSKVGVLARGRNNQHFRERDELRYSLRSVVSSLGSSLGDAHLLTADLLCTNDTCQSRGLGAGSEEESLEQTRRGEVPWWLDLSKVVHGNSSSSPKPKQNQEPEWASLSARARDWFWPLGKEDGTKSKFVVHHHSDVFDGENAARSIPSFNSIAIEAGIPNIPFDSDCLLYLNDDMFLFRPLSSSDVCNPLTGPVFRLQRDLLVAGHEKMHSGQPPDGEWPSLTYANWLLDQRFGSRSRPYIAHGGKSLLPSILQEIGQLWKDELQETMSVRFRGKGPEASIAFLALHYTIEKHREALLWTFFYGRADENQDGSLSPTEQRRLLSILGASPNLTFPVPVPKRSLLSTNNNDNITNLLNSAGIANTRETKHLFYSNDGYAHFTSQPNKQAWPSFAEDSERVTEKENEPVGELDVAKCFGENFGTDQTTSMVDVGKLMLRVAFEEPIDCGDLIIAILVGQSGRKGLSAFFSSSKDDVSSSILPLSPLDAVMRDVAEMGMTKGWKDVRYPRVESLAKAKELSVRLLQRYQYSVGDTTLNFVRAHSSGALKNSLSNSYKGEENSRNGKNIYGNAALLTINDDASRISDDGAARVKDAMIVFFKRVWGGVRTKWETNDG